jgi:hypothetical protein
MTPGALLRLRVHVRSRRRGRAAEGGSPEVMPTAKLLAPAAQSASSGRSLARGNCNNFVPLAAGAAPLLN